MNAKKRLLVLLVAVMVLSLATISAFADAVYENDIWGASIPSSAVSFSGSCKYGFTTTNSISKPTYGFGSTMYVGSEYVKWDDEAEYDMFMYVYAKDENGKLMSSTQRKVYTGWDIGYCSTHFSITPTDDGCKLFLRIENPGYTTGEINYQTGVKIQKISCKGKFWLG